jgi:hypothetical protein
LHLQQGHNKSPQGEKKMKRLLTVICILLVILSASGAIADDTKLKSHSSDMVGMKLDYPSGWVADDFSWGFMLTDPSTTASVSVQVFLMPAELEEAYNINLNLDFSKVYGDLFESVDEGEKEISGFTWDYVISRGSIGTPLEYFEASYSLLIENTIYSVQLFNPASSPKETLDDLKDVIDSVKLMYRESELPLIREYKKKWDKAEKDGTGLSFDVPTNGIKISYSPPWMFAGTGTSTDAAFHYLSGDPYKDIDMLLITIPNPDVNKSVAMLQGILASLTCPYSSDKEDEATFNREKYYIKLLAQGKDENVLHTRFYAVEHNDESTIIIFAYHEKAHEHADELIDDFMEGVNL